MSHCFNCKKKFVFFNVDRRRCKECEQYFCYNCTPTIFGHFCKICKILNTRPADHSLIEKIRSREIKMYLARRKIQTDSCIEKEELIKCFFKYVALEPQFKAKRAINKNFNSTWSTSTPNLNGSYREHFDPSCSQTPPARTPQSSASSSGFNTRPHDSQPNSPRETETTNNERQNSTNINFINVTSATSTLFVNPTEQNYEDLQTDIVSPVTEHIKLSDIQEEKNIQDLSIKQMKEILRLNRVDFKGCVEKDELKSKIMQLWSASRENADVSDLPSQELCKICMDAPLNSVLLECGHIVSCIDCGKQLAECPICRQYVTRVVHTFKA